MWTLSGPEFRELKKKKNILDILKKEEIGLDDVEKVKDNSRIMRLVKQRNISGIS